MQRFAAARVRHVLYYEARRKLAFVCAQEGNYRGLTTHRFAHARCARSPLRSARTVFMLIAERIVLSSWHLSARFLNFLHRLLEIIAIASPYYY